MNKIKIVHIVGTLGKGGAERFVVDLCNELAKNDEYELYIVSLRKNDPGSTFLKDVQPNVNYVSFDKNSGFSLKVLLSLTKWLRDKKPQIVHTHLNTFEYLSLYRLQNSDVKFFHTIHNMAAFECPNFLIKNARKFLYKNRKVNPVTISLNGSETYQQYYQLNNDILIENGRPALELSSEYSKLIEKYKRDSNTFLLLHVGRISEEKNQQLLISAVQKFNITEEKKCKLLIIGDVRDESLYRRLSEQVSDDQSIEFLGAKDNIADYLSIADFFCLSSIFEGMPISLIEAMSVGCIPVCTTVGGIKDMIIDKNTGFLSQDNSVDTYCKTIKEAVFCPDKQKIKENSINNFKLHYHIRSSTQKHSEAYNTVLNQK